MDSRGLPTETVDGTAAEGTGIDGTDAPEGTGTDAPEGTGIDHAEPGSTDAPGPRRRGPVRTTVSWVLNVVAFAVLMIALLSQDRLTHTRPVDLLRIPLEGVVVAILVLLLPKRSGRVVVVLGALLLSLINIGKVLDSAFYAVVVRPFDPTVDWVMIGDALDFLQTSVSNTVAIGAVIAVAVLVPLGIGVVVWSALRVSNLMLRHRSRSRLVVEVLAGFCVLSLGLNLHFVARHPLAARSALAELRYRYDQVNTSLADQAAIRKEAAVDPFRNVPADRLLTGLRGKNVTIAFVESYGRSAVEDPGMAPQVDAVLDAGTKKLAAAGFAARSGWLTSPTYAGNSWLAHSTLLSGLWVNSEGKYQAVTTSDRTTLNKEFRKAGWHTVGVEPAIRKAWPESKWYGYDQTYTFGNLGYKGPKFGYAPMTDEYILSTYQHRVMDKATGPVMGEVVLVSSHVPWAPLPKMVPWNQVGNGSIFGPMAAHGSTRAQVWATRNGIRQAYSQSVQYTLNTLVSYLQTYGTKNTVLIFLGDHQPHTVVTANKFGRDVPITIVAHDPAVLNRISGWGWTSGLRPAVNAPVWPMNAFRNKFLTAFGPQGGTAP